MVPNYNLLKHMCSRIMGRMVGVFIDVMNSIEYYCIA